MSCESNFLTEGGARTVVRGQYVRKTAGSDPSFASLNTQAAPI
jgi:hypothetical protein